MHPRQGAGEEDAETAELHEQFPHRGGAGPAEPDPQSHTGPSFDPVPRPWRGDPAGLMVTGRPEAPLKAAGA
ncbi:hypothetical protein Shyhy01_71240 [Streptomyces hygroscopicus subsp. hygroscopicus]|nr:hypothetical protein Shyhy01_71240 [Streptomyces hygroscopicus subsp. hygroscopicus]